MRQSVINTSPNFFFGTSLGKKIGKASALATLNKCEALLQHTSHAPSRNDEFSRRRRRLIFFISMLLTQ